jgi:WhiB family redox-sensing transcriptional regulator
MATDPKSPGSVAIFFGNQLPWSGSLQKYRKTDQEAGEEDMSAVTVRRTVPKRTQAALPCRAGDPDLWFAETPTDLERAKTLCVNCPVQRQCLAAAVERSEPWGVWGGEIFERGSIVSRKRPRGRPRKVAA